MVIYTDYKCPGDFYFSVLLKWQTWETSISLTAFYLLEKRVDTGKDQPFQIREKSIIISLHQN